MITATEELEFSLSELLVTIAPTIMVHFKTRVLSTSTIDFRNLHCTAQRFTKRVSVRYGKVGALTTPPPIEQLILDCTILILHLTQTQFSIGFVPTTFAAQN